jgi:hypothetical protein
VIRNPIEDGKVKYGEQKLVRGEAKFFLQPGEELVDGIKDIMFV